MIGKKVGTPASKPLLLRKEVTAEMATKTTKKRGRPRLYNYADFYAMKQDGKNNRQISREFDCTEETVARGLMIHEKELAAQKPKRVRRKK